MRSIIFNQLYTQLRADIEFCALRTVSMVIFSCCVKRFSSKPRARILPSITDCTYIASTQLITYVMFRLGKPTSKWRSAWKRENANNYAAEPSVMMMIDCGATHLNECTNLTICGRPNVTFVCPTVIVRAAGYCGALCKCKALRALRCADDGFFSSLFLDQNNACAR